MEYLLFLAGIIVLTFWQSKNFTTIKERFGENNVAKQLSKLPDNCIIFNDLYIPKKNGSTTQIDHIVINHNGLFVIETKHNNGWIMGSENSEYWTQVIDNQKENIYNPIWKNAHHIKVLQEYLGDTLNEVPIHSVIVFGKQSTLKLDKPLTKAKVIKSKKLLTVIQKELKKNFVYYSKRQSINQLLSSLCIEDTKTQERITNKHVINFKQYTADRNNKVKINVCPKCGGKLITRKGKNGEFKGCSNFPKCRFTA